MKARFLSLRADGTTRFLSVAAVAMGGISVDEGGIDIFPAKMPPMRIRHSDPRVVSSLAAILITYVTDTMGGKDMTPGVNSWGVDITHLIEVLENSFTPVHNAAVDVAAPSE